MNYEQKYKDALERAKKIRDSIIGSHNPESARLHVGHIENIFPELAESEDERIRKFLVEILSHGTWRKEWPFGPNEVVAYLEKQKEQSFTHHEIDESLRDAVTHQMEDDGDVDDFVRKGIDDIVLKYAELGARWQKEQKPAEWSEEDKKRIQRICDFLWKNRKGDTDTIYQIEKDADWLKSLRPKCVNVSDQTLQLLICYLHGCHDVAKRDGEKADCRRYISYLEDLDYTLKNRWKPSEEQIYSLGTVVNGIGESSFGVSKNLRDLYEQLKAL